MKLVKIVKTPKRAVRAWLRHSAGAVALALCLGPPACQSPAGGQRAPEQGPEQHTRRELELSAQEEAHLAQLAAAADAAPGDFDAHKRSGLAHMEFTLAGVLRLRARAEADLEAAFAIDRSDRVLNRSLGRFYNLRAVAGDYSKAEMQVEVYAALLGEQEVQAMNDEDFVAYAFSRLGAILAAKNRGRKLEALSKVNALERELAARVAAQPDNIELRALAGNFAFFFAGNIPLERERRVAEAVAYFEVLRDRWDELRAGARHPSHCPNTWENFMFELGEGLLVLERVDEAKAIYAELSEISAPRTRAKELIAHVAAERLRNASRYRGDMRLMPPWPSDTSNCVVCHAWSSDVGLASLYSLEPLRAEQVPSKAERKPIAMITSGPAQIRGRDALPEPVASLLESRCAPCHFAGGEGATQLDLTQAQVVEERAAAVLERVERGDMPPEGALDAEDRGHLRAWAQAR